MRVTPVLKDELENVVLLPQRQDESLDHYLRPEVAAFARLMESTLRRRGGHPLPRGSSLSLKVRHAEEELRELEDTLRVTAHDLPAVRPIIALDGASVATMVMEILDEAGCLAK